MWAAPSPFQQQPAWPVQASPTLSPPLAWMAPAYMEAPPPQPPPPLAWTAPAYVEAPPQPPLALPTHAAPFAHLAWPAPAVMDASVRELANAERALVTARSKFPRTAEYVAPYDPRHAVPPTRPAPSGCCVTGETARARRLPHPVDAAFADWLYWSARVQRERAEMALRN